MYRLPCRAGCITLHNSQGDDVGQRTVKRTRYPGIFEVAGGSAKRYMVMYRLPGVGQRSKTLGSLHDAKEFQARMRDPARARETRDLQRGAIPLREYFWQWLGRKRNLAESTKARYEGVGRMYISDSMMPLANLPVRDIRRDDVEDWISGLVTAGVGTATIDKAHRTLRACLSSAIREGKALANPATSIDLPDIDDREPFFLSAQQVDAIAGAVPARDRALVYFLAYTGLRIGEATAVRVRNLDLINGIVRVVESSPEVKGRKIEAARTKTKSVRAVSLPAPLVRELAAHLEQFGPRADDTDALDPSGYVFTGEKGGQVRQNNWRSRVFQPACLRAGVTRPTSDGGVEPPRVHDLRHTAASLAAAAGYSLHEVKEMLGHSTIKTTSDRYLHLFNEEKREKAERLGDLMLAARAQGTVVPLETARSVTAGRHA
jgi:integrase